ncbi:MAG: phosphatidylinositol mannoside acyltransferase [Acidimicrobiales bacterium]
MASRARVVALKTLGSAMEMLPERFDEAAAETIAQALGRRTTTARRHLEDNLRHVLAAPGSSVNADLLEEFVDRGFRGYGHYWAEGAKLPAIPRSTLSERFQIAEGLEHLLAAKAKGQGLIVALPHIGSWEWGGAFLNTIGLTMTAVAEELDPPELFTWFKKKREAMGILIEPLNEHAGTVLLSTLRAGGVVGLLCDRDIQGSGIEVDFFGERVAMPSGPATLALRTGATLVAAACYTGPGRDHYAAVTPPIDTTRTSRLREDVRRVTQEVTRELEHLIRRAPEQWHVLQPRFAS